MGSFARRWRGTIVKGRCQDLKGRAMGSRAMMTGRVNQPPRLWFCICFWNEIVDTAPNQKTCRTALLDPTDLLYLSRRISALFPKNALDPIKLPRLAHPPDLLAECPGWLWPSKELVAISWEAQGFQPSDCPCEPSIWGRDRVRGTGCQVLLRWNKTNDFISSPK